jgi:uncharacterized membrane protein YkvA (DUF1232 family)
MLRERLQSHFARLRREIRVYQLVLQDSRTPRIAKWMLGFAVAYLLMPFDIIPDFIPVFGQLDDIIIVPLLILLALKLTPKEVIADCRFRAGESKL